MPTHTPSRLTQDHLCELIATLATQRAAPLTTREVVSAVQQTAWGQNATRAAICRRLYALAAKGSLRRLTTRRRSAGGHTYGDWWPVGNDLPAFPRSRARRVGDLIAAVERFVRQLPRGATFTGIECAAHVRRRFPDVRGGTVTAALGTVASRALTVLVRDRAPHRWRSFWRVVGGSAADSGAATRRDSSAHVRERMWARVYEIQAETGRVAIDVADLLRAEPTPVRAAMRLAVTAALRPPKATVLQPQVQRLVHLGAVHYTRFVADGRHAERGAMEVALRTWLQAVRLLTPRVAREHERDLRGSRLPLHARVGPWATVQHGALNTLARLRDTQERACPWLDEVETELCALPWQPIGRHDDVGSTPLGTRWITVPEVRALIAAQPGARRVPSVRLLRFMLRSDMVWQCPARLIEADLEATVPRRAATLVEAVDAALWIHIRFGDARARVSALRTRHCIGLCRDTEAVRSLEPAVLHVARCAPAAQLPVDPVPGQGESRRCRRRAGTPHDDG